ncbi:MAG TPA: VOC family protein [Burkholderiales bacterium]|nr:VOC family protein [Burkholderiales bacterium]
MIKLNHTIVSARDKRASAAFLTEILGLREPPVAFGPFMCVQLGNEVTLDFCDDEGEIVSQHYAFLVGEKDFDQIFGRIQERKLDYWADPEREKPGEVYTWNGGRGVYFLDPSGHFLEIHTRPYF